MGYCAVLTGHVDCLKGIRGTRQWPATYPRKPGIMSATVPREGVIGRSPGLRSAINHSKGPSLDDPRAQVHRVPPRDPYLPKTSSTCQLILLAALNLALPRNHHFPLSLIFSSAFHISSSNTFPSLSLSPSINRVHGAFLAR